MRKFKGKTFEGFRDLSSGRLFTDSEFVHCHFVNCSFSGFDIVNLDNLDIMGLRSIGRNLRFVDCWTSGVSVGAGIVENVTVDRLKVQGHLQAIGTLFQHVTIKGSIDKFFITPIVDTFGRFPDVQKRFDAANQDYYKSVDWALDISEASFKDFDVNGVPTELIRRDKATQAVLTREKALEGKWKSLDLSKTYWARAIEMFLESGLEERLLVAPKRSADFRSLLDGISMLRDAGIVEPD